MLQAEFTHRFSPRPKSVQPFLGSVTDFCAHANIWRDQKRLDFPSFFLELVVIEALPWHLAGTLSNKVWRALEYVKANIASIRITDPANTNNIISADLSAAEKQKLSNAAATALLASTWGEIVI